MFFHASDPFRKSAKAAYASDKYGFTDGSGLQGSNTCIGLGRCEDECNGKGLFQIGWCLEAGLKYVYPISSRTHVFCIISVLNQI